MLPATGNALIIFFFCFGPGLVYENMQIRMAKRHGREFRHLSEETARVVGYIMLEGALFATAALSLFILLEGIILG
jgi:hypothetical protein